LQARHISHIHRFVKDISIRVNKLETQLRKILIDMASAFALADGCAVSGVGRRAKSDPNFFARLQDTSKTFTARTFDEVMGWMASNWPAGKQMPLDLLRWMAETGYQPRQPAEAQP
jgi:hypothetical protein